jgi:Gas vesicle synthesis protein GvpL/GvpF
MPGGDELRIELGRLLADHGGEVNGLIASAREEATARVRSLLVQAYTDVLLEQVHDELASARRSGKRADRPRRADVPVEAPRPVMESATPDTPASPAGDLGWYAYCVIDDDHEGVPDGLAGIDPQQPVTVVRHGELGAVVSRVPLAEFGEEALREHLSDMAWLERAARRHEHVLEAIARGGTPIPMRLCSIYRDEIGVREMLERETVALRQALAHLRGKAEWGVKAFADIDAVEPESSPEPAASGRGGGAAYMHHRLTERRRREDAWVRLEDACEALHAALCAVAVEGVTSAPQRQEVSGRDVPMIFNASYLVADAAADGFHRELARLRDELAPLGVDVQSTGPWPAYNFVPGAIGAAW